LCDWQFHKLGMQQLLLRDALRQPLLLCEPLFLNLIISHFLDSLFSQLSLNVI
jgi:hypothetical protein